MLLLSPSCVHATVNTPAEPTGARVARFPAAGSLPRFLGGSASALPFSRPAQRSLHVVACTLAEPPEAALFHRSASVRVVTSFYVREVAESRNPDRVREPLFPCRRRRKPPQRPATDASPPSAGRAPGAWPGPRRRRVGPFSSSAFRAVFELGRPVAAIPARPQRKRGYRPASQKDRNAGMSTGP